MKILGPYADLVVQGGKVFTLHIRGQHRKFNDRIKYSQALQSGPGDEEICNQKVAGWS